MFAKTYLKSRLTLLVPADRSLHAGLIVMIGPGHFFYLNGILSIAN
ncbi:MAG: hypothetical protein P8Z31_00275 [Gammaproteobacteria bacterium]